MRLPVPLVLALVIALAAGAHARTLSGIPALAVASPTEANATVLANSELATAAAPAAAAAAASQPSVLLGVTFPQGSWIEAPAVKLDTPGLEVAPRIINGEVDSDNLFPYAVKIEWDLGTAVASCTGSLVAPGFVLTAAHCFFEEGRRALPREVTVRVRGTGVLHSVSHLLVHEGYQSLRNTFSTASNDVAMVVLASTSPARTVRLPTWRQPTPGMTVVAAGFGITELGQSSGALRYTNLTVIAPGKCPLGFSRTSCSAGFLDNFVAGGFQGYTCNGDSGGPVVRATSRGDVLVGLTSWGDTNCYIPYSFYVRVYDHLDKILSWLQLRANTPQADVGLSDSVRQWMQEAVCAKYNKC